MPSLEKSNKKQLHYFINAIKIENICYSRARSPNFVVDKENLFTSLRKYKFGNYKHIQLQINLKKGIEVDAF